MSSIMDRVEGQTVARKFLETVDRIPDSVSLRNADGDDAWIEWTWSDYAGYRDTVNATGTGINLAAGKNLVGAFYEPAGVICDLALDDAGDRRSLDRRPRDGPWADSYGQVARQPGAGSAVASKGDTGARGGSYTEAAPD